MPNRHRVVVIGGGFGGLACVRALKRVDVDVTLVDRRNYHLFQPLLYQVATGVLSPANIASPLRGLVRHQKNCRVLLSEATDIDVDNRRVCLSDGMLSYDTLVVAAGARHSYFGHDDWEPFAPGLKTIEDATDIRKRILVAFESAEKETDPQRIREWLTFVIVGGGPTGVELAGALSEIANHTLKHDFRHITPSDAHIIIVEAGPHPLSMYPPELIGKATRSLKRLNVELRSHSLVTDIQADRVIVNTNGNTETIRTQTVIWAAGVAASQLGRRLAAETGCAVDRAGRVIVEQNLTITGHPEIFVIGDLANFTPPGGKPLPGLAPVAMQQGRYVARLIRGRLQQRIVGPFEYSDHGTMAVIGRYSAVALIAGWKLSGFLAWIVWLFVHLMEITQFRNRLLVLTQWGWTFFTRDRAARLITGFRPGRTDRMLPACGDPEQEKTPTPT